LDFVIVFFGVLEQWMLPLYHAIYALIMGHASTATLRLGKKHVLTGKSSMGNVGNTWGIS